MLCLSTAGAWVTVGGDVNGSDRMRGGGEENKQKQLNKQLKVSVNRSMLANMCTYLVIREHKVAA